MGTLLEDINLSIRNHGGRMTLAHLIVEETPGWFTIQNRRFFKRRAYESEAARRKLAKRLKSKANWRPEDVDYLLDKYGTMTIGKLARILGRTKAATQAKFYKSAPKEAIEKLPGYISGRGWK